MTIFEEVKNSVTASQAALQYGIKVGKNKMACCPFHKDHHPSMKVDIGFCCFACGEKGDVIAFVSKLFGLTPYEAARKLAEDFRIQLSSINKAEKKHRKSAKKSTRSKLCMEYQLQQNFYQMEQRMIRVLCDYLHLLERWRELVAPKTPVEDWKEEYDVACHKICMVEYYLDILLQGSLEEIAEFFIHKGEEVIQIENRMGGIKARNQGGTKNCNNNTKSAS